MLGQAPLATIPLAATPVVSSAPASTPTVLNTVDDLPFNRRRVLDDVLAFSYPPSVPFPMVLNAIDDLPRNRRALDDVSALSYPPLVLSPLGISWTQPLDGIQARPTIIDTPVTPSSPPIPVIQWSYIASDTIFIPDAPRDQAPGTFKAPAPVVSTISGMAWATLRSDQNFSKPVFSTDPVSILPVLTIQVSWAYRASDTIFIPDAPRDSAPALGTVPTAPIVSTIAGMAWFTDWPVVIPQHGRRQGNGAGFFQSSVPLTMGWYQPWQSLNTAARLADLAGSVVAPPASPPVNIPISGMAWAVQSPDPIKPRLVIQEATVVTPVALSPVAVTTMAWFQPWPFVQGKGIAPEAPLSIPYAPASLPLGWQVQAAPGVLGRPTFQEAPIQVAYSSIQAVIQSQSLAWQVQSEGLLARIRRPVDDPAALGAVSLPLRLSVAWMTAAELLARKPAPIDNRPALVVVPKPVPVSGMAWFNIQDQHVQSRFIIDCGPESQFFGLQRSKYVHSKRRAIVPARYRVTVPPGGT